MSGFVTIAQIIWSERVSMQFDDSKVTYELDVRQEVCPVRGNAMCSGDESFDREVEDGIIERLNNGDIWAWASVHVIARYEGVPDVHGDDYLGCCSYADEADFTRPGDYYDDMKCVAREDLKAKLEKALRALDPLQSGVDYPLPHTD